MILNKIGIDNNIIELYIIENNIAKKKKYKINNKITKYIGGDIDGKNKKNELNDLNTIGLTTAECSYDINSPICFNKTQLNNINNSLNIVASGNDQSDIITAQKKTGCLSQKCIATSLGMSHSMFKPDGPANSTDLLSNVDIDSVLNQFELKFPNFKALKFTMDDWFNTSYGDHDISKLGSDTNYICNILKNNKTCIGFIMNTDKWSGGGIHWTSMFIDMRDNNEWSVEFFNSSGNKPSKNILKLINNIVNNLYLCHLKPYNCTVTHINLTKNEHQLSDTECGLYSLFMIYNRCRGISSIYFENNKFDKIYDETMIQFRKYIFWNV
jgi:hypothetical protein